MQLLSEEDWLAVVNGRALDTELDFRRALSALRGAGEVKLASAMQKALRGFSRANPGRFPSELAQLQPYFDAPITAAMLDRWRIAPGTAVPMVGVGETIITQKLPPVDDVFDTLYVVGSGGGQGATDFVSMETREVMQAVFEAYQAAHATGQPPDFVDLQPYATTPEQQAALQKLLLRHSTSP